MRGKKSVEPLRVIFTDAEGVSEGDSVKRVYSFDEMAMALTGMNVAQFVKDIARNRNGKYSHILVDKE